MSHSQAQISRMLSDLRSSQSETSHVAINSAFYEILATVEDDAEEIQEFVAGPIRKRLDA